MRGALGVTAVRAAVLVVLLVHGLLHTTLARGGQLARATADIPYNAEGRHQAMAAAQQLVPTAYGALHSSSTFVMAGAFPKDEDRPYVVAAITDEPVTGELVAVRDLTDHPQYKYVVLAVAACAQMVGLPHEQVPYAIPDGAQFGALPLQAVAVDAPATDDGTAPF